MAKKSVSEVRMEKFVHLANSVKPPFNRAILCAFRPKERGEGILPNKENVDKIWSELIKVNRSIENTAQKKALEKLFGKNTPYTSIYDYERSAIPKPPEDYEEKLSVYKNRFPQFYEEAKKLADEENKSKGLGLRRNSREYKSIVKKYQKKLTLESIFGKGTKYESIEQYKQRGLGEAELKPKDWDEKYKQYNEYVKKIIKDERKKALENDPKLAEKDLCFRTYLEWKGNVEGKIMYKLSKNYGFDSELFSKKRLNKKIYGDVIKSVVTNDGKPLFTAIPYADLNITIWPVIINKHAPRTELKKYNKDLKKYFVPSAIKNALKDMKAVYGNSDLPDGWHVSENTKDRFTFTQPHQVHVKEIVRPKFSLHSLLTSDELRENIEKSTKEQSILFPVPVVYGKKENDNGEYRVNENNTVTFKEFTLPNRKKAIEEAFCFMKAYEKGWDAKSKVYEEKIQGKVIDETKAKELIPKASNIFNETFNLELNSCRQKHGIVPKNEKVIFANKNNISPFVIIPYKGSL